MVGERGTATVHCDKRGVQCRAASVYGKYEVHAVTAPLERRREHQVVGLSHLPENVWPWYVQP